MEVRPFTADAIAQLNRLFAEGRQRRESGLTPKPYHRAQHPDPGPAAATVSHIGSGGIYLSLERRRGPGVRLGPSSVLMGSPNLPEL